MTKNKPAKKKTVKKDMTYANELKAKRLLFGLSQMGLASRAGISKGYLQEVEKGKNPSKAIRAKLDKAFPETPAEEIPAEEKTPEYRNVAGRRRLVK